MINMPPRYPDFQKLTPQTRDFLQKICFKKAASIDMTQYGFITDSKIQPLSLLLKPLQAQLAKMVASPRKGSKMRKDKLIRYGPAYPFMSEDKGASQVSSKSLETKVCSKSQVKANRQTKTNNNVKKKKSNYKKSVAGGAKKGHLRASPDQFHTNVRHSRTKTHSTISSPRANKRSGATSQPIMVVMQNTNSRKRWPRSRRNNKSLDSMKVKQKVKFATTCSPPRSPSPERSRRSSPKRKVLEQTYNVLVSNKNQRLQGAAARMLLKKHQELEMKMNPNISRNHQYVVQENATSLIFNTPNFKDSTNQRNTRRPKYARNMHFAIQGRPIKVINLPARKLDKGIMVQSSGPLKKVKRSTFPKNFAKKPPPEVPYRPDLSLATRTTSDRFSSPIYYQSPTAYHTEKLRLQREKRIGDPYQFSFPFRTVPKQI